MTKTPEGGVKWYQLETNLAHWQMINCDQCKKRETCIPYERLTQAWFTNSVTDYIAEQVGGYVANDRAILKDRCAIWDEMDEFKLPM